VPAWWSRAVPAAGVPAPERLRHGRDNVCAVQLECDVEMAWRLWPVTGRSGGGSSARRPRGQRRCALGEGADGAREWELEGLK
jgi:hypothetical protein